MNRLSFAFAAALTLVACGPKDFGSVCSEVPAPPACMTACDPTPGAASTCVAGFHCSADGKCDAQCTVGGGQCGSGYMCTTDGYCVDDGSGSGGNGPDASCPAINFTPMPSTPSIGLVLDQSGSMSTNLGGGLSRYQAMAKALVDPTTGVVSQLETKAYFGSELYTCNGTTPQFTVIPRALMNAAAIRASINGNSPASSTPTAQAIDAERLAFAASPPPAGSPPIIVLATDGEPNSCNQNLTQAQYNQQSVDAAKAAYAAGIPVYVLAIATGGSQHFQDVANAGQGWVAPQPNVTYYPVASPAALAAAFQTIINGVISCDLKLTSNIDANSAMSGTVILNGQTLMYGTDWTLVGGNVVRLTGSACNTLKGSTNPAVTASFPCGSVIF